MVTHVHLQRCVKIPLRDGIHLNATLYLPRDHKGPSPSILTLTPYVGQRYHDEGSYFAGHGYPFLTVDVRGRGDSEGNFQPFIQEAEDGYDVVEWLAGQPYCDGQVTMWGGSYGGHNQWATAKEFPPHLVTIVPFASVHIGVDFPMRSNIWWPYVMQWLTLVSGRTAQEKIFEDHRFWSQAYREHFERGVAFNELDAFVGNPSSTFQQWISHPEQDGYWQSHNPTPEEYAKLSIPILTITGIYDNAQLGALTHFREHLQRTSAADRAPHYLVIGPWDHAGTRAPRVKFAGLELGPASLVDLPQLHLQWYAWTMQNGPKPEFLQKPVAYYVTGAERWRYADTLDAVTAYRKPLYLDSAGTACRIFSSGTLSSEMGTGSEDAYVYDPCDTSIAELEWASSDPLCLRPTFPTNDLSDQKVVYANDGKQIVYHSFPFEQDAEISGSFELSAWISIDQPDTDFRASVYEIDPGGRSILLTGDSIRARYRESLREAKLVATKEPLRYDFERFTFVSRLIRKGSRLRLVVGPINSIYGQKNYNSGGVVAKESMQDARAVTVKLFHDRSHPSVLLVPFGQPEI